MIHILSQLSVAVGKLASTIGILSVALASAPAIYGVLPPQSPRMELEALLGVNPTQGQIRAVIAKSAQHFGISGYLALSLAEDESRFNPRAKNPSSTAKGIYQFLDGTFETNCEGNPFDPIDNIVCAHQMLSENPLNIRHWTADLNARQKLLDRGLVECLEGKNNCKLKHL